MIINTLFSLSVGTIRTNMSAKVDNETVYNCFYVIVISLIVNKN